MDTELFVTKSKTNILTKFGRSPIEASVAKFITHSFIHTFTLYHTLSSLLYSIKHIYIVQ